MKDHDLGFTGGKSISTPHPDAPGRSGVFLTHPSSMWQAHSAGAKKKAKPKPTKTVKPCSAD